MTAQEDADESGAPGGVLAAEGEGVVMQRLGGRSAGALAVAVGGGENRIGVKLPAVQELADGAWGQAEGVGDSEDGLTALVASKDGLTEGEGSRCWHGKSSQKVEN